MAKQGRPPTAAEFQHWLKPDEALSRLPADWSVKAKRDAIIRRIGDGSLLALARTVSVQNRGEPTAHYEMAGIDPAFWRDPWRGRDSHFWTTGDIAFDDEPPMQLLYTVRLDDEPYDDEARRIITFKDLRIEPGSFASAFAGHLPPDEPQSAEGKTESVGELHGPGRPGALSAAEFEDWLHPCDVIEHYHQNREPDPKSLVVSMLRDGKLRAAATQLVLNSRDHGLALIPPQVWEWAAGTEVWSTGHFRLTHISDSAIISVSAYDVRIDPNVREVPGPDPASAQPIQDRPTHSPAKGKGGRSSGHHGIVIATLAKRLMALSEADLQAYEPRRLQSELIEEYRAHGCTPPSAENVTTIAAGILKALRS